MELSGQHGIIIELSRVSNARRVRCASSLSQRNRLRREVVVLHHTGQHVNLYRSVGFDVLALTAWNDRFDGAFLVR